MTLVLALAALACGSAALPEPPPPDEPLAQVGERVISVAAFADALEDLSRQASRQRAGTLLPAQYPAFLERLIDFELLAAEAERRGLDRLPDVEERIARALARGGPSPRDPDGQRRRALASLLVEQELAAGRIVPEPVADGDLRRAYERDVERFQRPERVRVWVVLLPHEAAARELAAEARDLAPSDLPAFNDLLLDYAAFGAQQMDVGERGVLERGSPAPAEIVAAAFELSLEGAVSDPVRIGAGYAVVRLLARYPSRSLSLEQARPLLEPRLKRAALDAAVARFAAGLRSNTPVRRFEPRLQAFLASYARR